MHGLHWLKSLVVDPPPEIACEVSAHGIAWPSVVYSPDRWSSARHL